MAVWTFTLSAVYLPQHSGFVRSAGNVSGTVTKVDGSAVTVMQGGSVVPKVTTDAEGGVQFTIDRTEFTAAPEVLVDFGIGALHVKADEYGEYLQSIATGTSDPAVANLVADPASSTRAQLDDRYIPRGSMFVAAADHGLATANTAAANTTALQAAIDAANTNGIPEVRVTDAGTYTLNGSIVLRPGVALTGIGNRAVTLSYTGTGSFIVQPTPGTRVYSLRIANLTISGPGTGTATVGVDLDSVSTSRFDDVAVTNFGKAWRIGSAINGGAVYNTFVNCNASGATTGFAIEATGSNATRFIACRAYSNTTGLAITDSNNTTWIGGQIEANTTGVLITATTNGAADSNLIESTRFENNTTAWNVSSSNVRYTAIIHPQVFGAYTTSDSGSNTTQLGGNQPYRLASQAQSTSGSWRFTRNANGGSETPAVVFSDANTSAGVPVTVQIETERNGGYFLRGKRGGTTYFDVSNIDGSTRMPLGGYHELAERAADPAAPAANTMRLYAKDVGGKTALFAIFPTGAAVQIAVEP